MTQGLLKSNLFTFYVREKDPHMTFGYYDKSLFKGDIHWNPVEFKYLYGIKLDDIKVGGKNLNICAGRESCLVTADSGASMNGFPSFAHEIFKKNGLPHSFGPVDCKSP